MSILVVMEQRAGEWNRMSFETLAAAQQLAGELGVTASAAILGEGLDGLAAELASRQLEKVYTVEHELLKEYTPDAWSSALRQLIAHVNPTYVLFPHTYQVRDFLPKLATAAGKVAVNDVVGHRLDGSELILVRQLFQGKVNVDVRFAGGAPHFASLQAGAWRADQARRRRRLRSRSSHHRSQPRRSAANLRSAFANRRGQSISPTAELIVAVGRGIKEADNIHIVQELADVLGAELAASRPICDAGWLPMERQVGSSGQTVGPKLYMAIGISGAIQHLVGMKGARTIVAINKDPNAPIFEVADYGIVGDLFQVVPALIEAFKKAR